ncbi:conserved hypothetical protein [Candidatus Sulfopaludibacter sp. SbA4]|nr:conserved hypothetical protein [Candidatus Sulfopaludibacter sp. SbA4]
MPTDAGINVPESLMKNLDWYIANQQELSAKYNGKILLIVDQALVQVFDDMGEAYTKALESYAPGTFTLQPCSPDADSYTLMLYSPVYTVIACPPQARAIASACGLHNSIQRKISPPYK